DSSNITKTQSTATPTGPISQETSSDGGSRRQETMGGASVQTRFEMASKLSYDSPLRGGNTPRSDEDRMTLQELMALCTKLSDRVLALETDLRQTKKGRMIEEMDQDVGVALVTPTIVSSQEDQPEDQLLVLSAAKVLADATRVHTYSKRRRVVSNGSGGVSTASRIVSTAGLIQQVNIIIPSSSVTKDKGKAIMTESKSEQTTTHLKQRQKRVGYEAAIRLQEQLNEEESQRISRDAKGFTEDEWEDIRERVEADEVLTQKLQVEERHKYSKVDQARMLIGEGSEPAEESKDELSQEQLQQLMIIVPEEGMNVEALQTKYLIIDWEVYTEDSRMYWKIIRVVHKRFNSTEPTGDKERELWVELKRLFEPDDDDIL
ncbi:hypothetical protein Tco_1364572, partial [Tanacetum coccineum]